jgi:radical SAM protein with 4Fe4S-binding SPASM domain
VDEVRFKTAQVYSYTNGNPLIPEQQKYSRYKKMSDGTYRLKNKMSNHCWNLWHSCVFTWDGNVLPCCFDKDAAHVMGSIEHQDFAAIWRNEHYLNFRRQILKGRKEIEICRNCTEGTKIWA